VFWYCYKRGRDTRLERERLSAEGASDMESSSDLEDSILEDSTPGQPTLKQPAPASVPLPETPHEK